MRLLYRLHRFGELLPVRIDAEIPLSAALMPSKLLLNVPSDDRTVAQELERLRHAVSPSLTPAGVVSSM